MVLRATPLVRVELHGPLGGLRRRAARDACGAAPCHARARRGGRGGRRRLRGTRRRCRGRDIRGRRARVARVVPLLVRAALGVDADDVGVLGTMQAAAPLAMPLTLVVGALRRSRRREREPAPRPSTRVAYAARRQARAVPMARRQRRRHVRRGAPVGRRRDHYRTFACCGFAGFADFSACGDTTRLLRLGL